MPQVDSNEFLGIKSKGCHHLPVDYEVINRVSEFTLKLKPRQFHLNKIKAEIVT